MPFPALLVGLTPVLVACYFCLFGPGQAWWHGSGSALPRAFARVALTLTWTSLAGLALAATNAFSLPRLVAINSLVTLVGYLLIGRVRRESLWTSPRAGLGPLLCLTALLVYWPPYESHIAGSDSTTYTAAGIHLARAHSLSKEDELAPLLSPGQRVSMFASVVGPPHMPPYSRMPGGMVIDSPHSSTVHPSFFPLPSIWAAAFADAIGARYAGGYAGLFGALSLWAIWLFARRRVGPAAAAGVVVLAGMNAATYWAARIPLSESIACFFAWSGLVALDAWEDDGMPADGWLAGMLLGAAGLVRVELAFFILTALGLRRLVRGGLSYRPPNPGFYVALTMLLAATAAEAALLHGAHTAPIAYTWRGILFHVVRLATVYPLATGVAVATGSALAWLGVRRRGAFDTLLAVFIGIFLGVYFFSGVHSWVLRSLGWLGHYLGWPTLVLAAAGFVWCWRERHATAANGFFVLLAGLAAALLIYHPHVLPAMPWASRRYVPIVIPAAIVLSALAAAKIGRRQWLAGALTWALLLVSVLWPAKTMWGRDYYAGTYDQLAAFERTLPQSCALLIDARLGSFILGTPLWLLYDRNSLPVFTGNDHSRKLLTGTVMELEQGGIESICLIKSTLSPSEPIPYVAASHHSDYTFQIPLPEQTAGPPPKTTEHYTQSVSVYTLQTARFRNRPAPALP